MRESKLQSKVIKDLELLGWVVHKVIKSSKSGWPDIEMYKNKISMFIETKGVEKEARKLQQYRHRILRDQGFNVYVVDTWESYLQIRNNFNTLI